MLKYFLLLFCMSAISFAGPKILIVTAHPDDESACAASVFKLTHDLAAKVDILLVTNGEGGYKYSVLAEDLYDLPLTKELVGREYLPSIRKKELMAGGKYIGIRNYYFLDQKDTEYTLNPDSVLNIVWDTSLVLKRIQQVHSKNNYDYVFVLLPTESTHGHHKAATILALQAIRNMSQNMRPVIVGFSVVDSISINPEPFKGLSSYPLTSIASGLPIAGFNRNQKFGFNNRLDYSIIVNWLIAEHKSQGAMQLGVGKGDIEYWWNFDINGSESTKKIQALVDTMNATPYKIRVHNEQ